MIEPQIFIYTIAFLILVSIVFGALALHDYLKERAEVSKKIQQQDPNRLDKWFSDSEEDNVTAGILETSEELRIQHENLTAPLLRKELAQKERAIEYLKESKNSERFTAAGVVAILEMEEKISKIKDSLAKNSYRKPNEKSGYVYIISNPAFRSEVLKIGMTCATDPTERVKSLYNTSTPLHFEIQILHYSENALAIEQKLHEIFRSSRINARREFFYATTEEILEKLQNMKGSIIYLSPEADQCQSSQRSGRRSVTLVKAL
jgi:hypothetical protein